MTLHAKRILVQNHYTIIQQVTFQFLTFFWTFILNKQHNALHLFTKVTQSVIALPKWPMLHQISIDASILFPAIKCLSCFLMAMDQC